ncbi:hypothetical protein [Caulobacter rhizosphaerae]|uniref:hypothetical protein n=1 Tax=Caulobacter rhizosphaerae TaxID=2010972 RepID=UPI0013D89EAD|nr:hypothetical protein [Caulobacter rhizosphaerae]GGL48219.1 hypothetical protein GCM10010983_51970 [Caulobacter rhizosphaerae]
MNGHLFQIVANHLPWITAAVQVANLVLLIWIAVSQRRLYRSLQRGQALQLGSIRIQLALPYTDAAADEDAPRVH